jgi:hypothetical protein
MPARLCFFAVAIAVLTSGGIASAATAHASASSTRVTVRPVRLPAGFAAAAASDTIDECIAPAAPACAPQSAGLKFTIDIPYAPSGLTVTYSATTLPKGITASFSPLTTKTAPYTTTETLTFSKNATVTNQALEQVDADCGATYYCYPAQAQFEVECSLAYKTCPELQISDANQKSPIVSGSPPPTTNTVVGYQIDATVAYKAGTGTGSYGAVAGIDWTVSGNPIGDYGRDGKPPQPFTGSKTAPNVKFYYYQPSSAQPLAVRGKLTRSDSQEIADPKTEALYNVQTPDAAIAFSGATPGVHVVRVLNTLAYPYALAFTNAAGIGFDVRYDVTDAKGYGGEISETQLVDASTERCDSRTIVHTPAGPMLDHSVDYPESPPAGAGPITVGTTWQATDTPSQPLLRQLHTVARSDAFTSYFMYKPDMHGIWVTLQTVDWAWYGTAARTTGPNEWCLGGTVRCSAHAPPGWYIGAPTATTSFPMWSGTLLAATPCGLSAPSATRSKAGETPMVRF